MAAASMGYNLGRMGMFPCPLSVRKGAEMSRYEVVSNLEPGKVLLETDSLDEACYFVGRERLMRRKPPTTFLYLEPFGNKYMEYPPLLAPDVGTLETEWHYDSVPGEPQKSYVLYKDGHPVVMGDEEVLARAARYRDEYYERIWWRRRADRRNGQRPSAARWYMKGNAHHRTMRLDDERDGDSPRIRPGARVPDAWDAREGPVKTSKSWKDQSKRRRQWKPIDMTTPPTDDGKPDGGNAGGTTGGDDGSDES